MAIALHQAARAGDVAAIAAAIEADASCVKQTDGLNRTALHLAAWAGQTLAVSQLIAAGASVHATAQDGITALAFAAQNGHTEAVKQLLLGGAKVNVKDSKKQNTPLHLAASKGHAACVAYLLKKNADARMKNKAGRTPLDVCTSDELKQMLLAASRGGERRQSDGEASNAAPAPAHWDVHDNAAPAATSSSAAGESFEPTAEHATSASAADVPGAADGLGHKRRADATAGEEAPPAKASHREKRPAVKLAHLDDDGVVDEAS